jgi:hypothetical protein
VKNGGGAGIYGVVFLGEPSAPVAHECRPRYVPHLDFFETNQEISRQELESFIGERLTDAGVWKAPRTSDGISLLREVERAVALVRFCGQIWQIDQTLHTFWLDVERVEQELRWTLYFDPIIDSPRRARNAAYSVTGPEVVEWRVTVSGKIQDPSPR